MSTHHRIVLWHKTRIQNREIGKSSRFCVCVFFLFVFLFYTVKHFGNDGVNGILAGVMENGTWFSYWYRTHTQKNDCYDNNSQVTIWKFFSISTFTFMGKLYNFGKHFCIQQCRLYLWNELYMKRFEEINCGCVLRCVFFVLYIFLQQKRHFFLFIADRFFLLFFHLFLIQNRVNFKWYFSSGIILCKSSKQTQFVKFINFLYRLSTFICISFYIFIRVQQNLYHSIWESHP